MVVATAVVLLFLFLGSRVLRGSLTGPLTFLARPWWQASDRAGNFIALELGGLNSSREQLLSINKNLQTENAKLKTLLLAKQGVENDNLRLRKILGRQTAKTQPLVAQVVFLPNFIPYNNLLLDLGTNNSLRGLKVGDLDIADGMILIGRIAEVDNAYSKARLISAENNLAVVIGNKNIPATANGSGAGNFTITLPKDTAVAVGDRVLAPLLNNYLIGIVGHIEKISSRPTQTILVQTPINLWELKWLEVYDLKT